MRFQAPVREQVPAQRFDHPAYAALQPWRGLLQQPDWPDLDTLAAAFIGHTHAVTGQPLRPVAQSAALLADGLHFETRIHRHGAIATRERCWHDQFNALSWLAFGPIKSALNQRQVADIERVGARQRTRAQCALTHFDEAGAVLVLRDPARLAAWDRHDWSGLFSGLSGDDYALALIGHALLEHALLPAQMLVAKALVVVHPQPHAALHASVHRIAESIGLGQVLADPQELRPLPLMGLPGWHPQAGQTAFLQSAPCFRPARAGRRYPSALVIRAVSLNAAA